MAMLAALRFRLQLLVASESGMALPVAMLATVASLGLAGAAVMSSVDVQQGTHRDSDSKSAIAAADAGASVARLRLNHYANSLSSEAPCLNVNLAGMLEPGAAAADGWCAPIEGTVGGGATYSYRMSPVGDTCGGSDLCVVATGSADEVTRRIQVAFDEQGPGSEENSEETNEEESTEEEEEKEEEAKYEGLEGITGVDWVKLENNASTNEVNIGSNGTVYIENNATVCGHIRYGVGKPKPVPANNGKQCEGYEMYEQDVVVPPVSSFIPSDIATNNSNYRLVRCTQTSPTKKPTGCQSDYYSEKWGSTTPWNATTRTISASNNASLTLSGGDYFVCRMILSNNVQLIMADGANVRIFFDTPENCNLSSGTKQLDIGNNASITSTGYQANQGKFDVPGFYLLGSDTRSTKVEWSNNSGTNEIIIYAPKSEVILKNNATFYGAIVGKTVYLWNNVHVEYDEGFTLPPEIAPPEEEESEESEEETVEEEEESTEVGVRYFTPQSYVECSGEATPTPDANC